MIKLLGNKVLVEITEHEEKTKSGIVIPDSAKEKPQEGIVVESGVKGIKKGTRVLFSKYGPVEIKIDEKNYVVIEETDLLAIIE